MRLGTALVAAFMILVIFGVADTPLKRIGLSQKKVFFLMAAVLLLHAFPVRVMQEFSFDPGAVFLLLLTGGVAMGRQNGFFSGLLLALPIGAAMFLLRRLPLGSEPGFSLGLIAGMGSVLLLAKPKGAAFSAVLSPIAAQLFLCGWELIDFGYTRFELGMGEYYDAMAVGLAFSFLVYSLSLIRIRRARTTDS